MSINLKNIKNRIGIDLGASIAIEDGLIYASNADFRFVDIRIGDVKNKFDSFNTVSEVKEFLFMKNKPINFNPKKSPNSQNLPDIVKLNFAINILLTEQMFKTKTLIGRKPYFFKLNQIPQQVLED